ncbi:MAG TPA: integrase core domain-containing protein [Candidatus Paceibacterota bacterium]|nr:integrase core domain-containing protein [Candidatus Pacearchaeota archaeon]HRZ50782.1 integrase core domain-containing protein [Candidatus Paceibacterota bacterium]HSA36321.1 integrase core domain-containing protein [Candidatus Paceibacterota bacterium]
MYDKNPNLPRVRMQAVRMVASGMGIRAVARHLGYTHEAVRRWVARARNMPSNAHRIPTRSSRPHSHPKQMPQETLYAILAYRKKYQRCAPVLHHLLIRDGYRISKSSVERVLRRYELVRHSKWKKWHSYPPKPLPTKPGILVQMDTVQCADRSLYLYTSLDVCSRYAHASVALHANTHNSIKALLKVREIFPFPIGTLQTDHGSEFSKYFTKRCTFEGIAHRHSRIRTPTDNSHLERFNRTIQEECLSRVPDTLASYRRALTEYLRFYNFERPHMALKMRNPRDFLTASGYKVLT